MVKSILNSAYYKQVLIPKNQKLAIDAQKKIHNVGAAPTLRRYAVAENYTTHMTCMHPPPHM
jgi:hypothetical protein